MVVGCGCLVVLTAAGRLGTLTAAGRLGTLAAAGRRGTVTAVGRRRTLTATGRLGTLPAEVVGVGTVVAGAEVEATNELDPVRAGGYARVCVPAELRAVQEYPPSSPSSFTTSTDFNLRTIHGQLAYDLL